MTEGVNGNVNLRAQSSTRSPDRLLLTTTYPILNGASRTEHIRHRRDAMFPILLLDRPHAAEGSAAVQHPGIGDMMTRSWKARSVFLSIGLNARAGKATIRGDRELPIEH
jgi:hypothetical protein